VAAVVSEGWMRSTFETVTADQCDDLVELTLSNGPSDLSVVMMPEQWAALVDQAEELDTVKQYRHRRSVEAAREAASHATRGIA
jgi:hypothetical protein